MGLEAPWVVFRPCMHREVLMQTDSRLEIDRTKVSPIHQICRQGDLGLSTFLSCRSK